MIRTDPLSNESFFEVGNYEEIPINDKLIAYLMKETSLSGGGTSSVDIIIPGSEAVQTYSFHCSPLILLMNTSKKLSV